MYLYRGLAGGHVQLESCEAAINGGAIYALAPVRFSMSFPSSLGYLNVKVQEARTTMAGNVAGLSGGGIAAWAPIYVEFGYRLVCTFEKPTVI
jgi:hypothetical protein